MKKLALALASVALTVGLVGATSAPAQADSSWDCVVPNR